MKEFEKALQELKTPDIAVPEYQEALRRELRQALRHRRQRRSRVALGASSSLALVLMATVAVFILRPSVPSTVHAALFHDETPAPSAAPLSGPSTTAGAARASVDGDLAWLEQWYAENPDRGQVRSLEEERFFALRRFELVSGKRVIVFTEVGESPDPQPRTVMAAVRNF